MSYQDRDLVVVSERGGERELEVYESCSGPVLIGIIADITYGVGSKMRLHSSLKSELTHGVVHI